MNDEDGGRLFLARPVDVHLHGIAPRKSPGASLHPDGNDEWNGSAVAARRGSLQRSKWVWGGPCDQSADERLLASARERG